MFIMDRCLSGTSVGALLSHDQDPWFKPDQSCPSYHAVQLGTPAPSGAGREKAAKHDAGQVTL